MPETATARKKAEKWAHADLALLLNAAHNLVGRDRDEHIAGCAEAVGRSQVATEAKLVELKMLPPREKPTLDPDWSLRINKLLTDIENASEPQRSLALARLRKSIPSAKKAK